MIAPARVVPTAVEPPPAAARAGRDRGARWTWKAPDRRDIDARRRGDRHARRAPARLGRPGRVAPRLAARVAHDGRSELDDVGTVVDTGRDTPGGDDRPATCPAPDDTGDDVGRPRDDVGSDDARRSLPPRRPRRRPPPRRRQRPPARQRPPRARAASSRRATGRGRRSRTLPTTTSSSPGPGRSSTRGSPTEPRLTLPSSLVFRPGAYRWVVRPGFGVRTAKNLGPPVVDSPFTVS